MESMEKRQKFIIIITSILTLVLFIHSVMSGFIAIVNIDCYNFIFFSVLVTIAESFTVVFSSISVSLSFTVALISYILLGPVGGILILLTGYIFRVVKVDGGYIHIFNTPLEGTVFNCCVLIMPMIVGNYFYIISGGRFNQVQLNKNLLPIMIFSIVYSLVNVILVSSLWAARSKKNILLCVYKNSGIGFLSMIITIPISLLAVVLFQNFSYIGIIFILAFVLLLRYTLMLYSNSREQFTDTVTALMNAVEARDKYTNGHSKRVAEISVEISQKIGISYSEIKKINVAAMLHDVGKIGVSDAILQKPSKLTKEEFDAIKAHPDIGMNIVKGIKNIEYVYSIVKYHHERYDGNGYPDGKKGDELPLEVYIVQLADAVDAMKSDRPYRKGLSREEIISEIKKGSGTQFHPKVARAYLELGGNE